MSGKVLKLHIFKQEIDHSFGRFFVVVVVVVVVIVVVVVVVVVWTLFGRKLMYIFITFFKRRDR